MTGLAGIGRADALNYLRNGRKKKMETVVTLLLQTLVGRIGNPSYLPEPSPRAGPNDPNSRNGDQQQRLRTLAPVPRHDADDENPLLCYDRVEIQIFGTEE